MAKIVFKGSGYPTSMAFLGPNDILVLEKNTGMVKRIVNGVKLKKPLLDVNVANQNERGTLGIAVVPKRMKIIITELDTFSCTILKLL